MVVIVVRVEVVSVVECIIVVVAVTSNGIG